MERGGEGETGRARRGGGTRTHTHGQVLCFKCLVFIAYILHATQLNINKRIHHSIVLVGGQVTIKFKVSNTQGYASLTEQWVYV